MGLWLVLLSEKPSSTSRVVRQQIAKTVFKLFNLYSYIIFGVGGGSSKNSHEIKRRAEPILLLRTGHHIIIFHLKPIFQPTLPDNYCTILYNYLHKILFRSQETKNSFFFLIDICFSYENCTNVKCRVFFNKKNYAHLIS